MAIRMDFVINAVLVAAILWRLPVMDWAIAVFGADAFSKWSGFWQSSIGSDTLASTLDFVSTAMPTAASDVLSSSVQRRAEGAVFGALLGDALALQTHYEYDYGKIRNFYRIRLNGTVEKLGEQLRRNADILGLAVTPGFEGADMKNWHPGKEGGDLTDHGDCVVMALEFLASHKWSLEAFDAYWWDWIQSYKGYVNMATKAIVKRRQAGHGGPGRLGWPPSGEDLFALCLGSQCVVYDVLFCFKFIMPKSSSRLFLLFVNIGNCMAKLTQGRWDYDDAYGLRPFCNIADCIVMSNFFELSLSLSLSVEGKHNSGPDRKELQA